MYLMRLTTPPRKSDNTQGDLPRAISRSVIAVWLRSMSAIVTASLALILAATPSSQAAVHKMNLAAAAAASPNHQYTMGTAGNPAGDTIGFSQTSLLYNGKPWLPSMGEFHYARYPASQWRAELLKMKAGGINIVSTYVFWIYHEEVLGKWDWSGRRDLRHFLVLCKQVGLKAIVRLGPWAHGEVRNGGLPDWVLHGHGKLRSTDPRFLNAVHTLYAHIAEQLHGLLWKDGGPVIGIQVSNEYDGPAKYLLTLRHMARQVGIDVPLYTRTAWPRPNMHMPFGSLLPLAGGYPNNFWSRSTKQGHAGWKRYIFQPEPRITAKSKRQPSVEKTYPYLTTELGGGMETSYSRRPYVYPDDIAAEILTAIGSGDNLVGMYMYHGGINPQGKRTPLQETQRAPHTHYNDMPVKAYDFQALLGSFGQVRQDYHQLRRMFLFLGDYGRRLATWRANFPAHQPDNYSDTSALRWAVRSNGHSGLLFVNDYQQHTTMPAKQDVHFRLKLAGGVLSFPDEPITIPANSYFFWPFNFKLAGFNLVYATAQPIARVREGKTTYVAFAQTGNVPADFAFSAANATLDATTGQSTNSSGRITIENVKPGLGAAIHLTNAAGKKLVVVLLSPKTSLHLWQGKLAGRQRLIITKANLILDGNAGELESAHSGNFSLALLPAPKQLRLGGTAIKPTSDGLFARFTKHVVRPGPIQPTIKKIKSAGPARHISKGRAGVASEPTDDDFNSAAVWRIHLPRHIDQKSNLLLRIHYIGDAARLYLGHHLLNNNFYNGRPLDLGLRRFAPSIYHGKLLLKILPLQKNAPVYIPEKNMPAFAHNKMYLKLKKVHLIRRLTMSIHAN